MPVTTAIGIDPPRAFTIWTVRGPMVFWNTQALSAFAAEGTGDHVALRGIGNPSTVCFIEVPDNKGAVKSRESINRLCISAGDIKGRLRAEGIFAQERMASHWHSVLGFPGNARRPTLKALAIKLALHFIAEDRLPTAKALRSDVADSLCICLAGIVHGGHAESFPDVKRWVERGRQ